MKKELFVKTMNKIQSLNEEQHEFNDMLKKIDPEFGGGYIYSKVIDFMIDILKELVNDKYDEIGYYAWELDFGKSYKDGCITSLDGEVIKLSTPEELYDLIEKDNEETTTEVEII